MKKIGMIGGLSWISTAEYYRLINERTQKRLGGVNSAHIILESLNREKFLEHTLGQGDETSGCQMVLDAAKSVERAGADFIVITCNGAHRFASIIQENIDIKLLHIVDAVADKIAEHGFRTVSLLGVRKTMESDFYPNKLNARGISTIVPSESQRTIVHDQIYDELAKGIFTPETRAKYLAIIEDLQSKGAQGAILGCTEIPLLIRQEDTDIPLFSTTEIHCDAALDFALS